MRLRCHLRDIRERMPRKPDRKKVSLSDIAAASNVSGGVLSQIERGIYLPTDTQIPALEQAYGVPASEFWPPRVLLVLEGDETE
jgi:transcriptional regulator with XRE-family HTH domain